MRDRGGIGFSRRRRIDGAIDMTPLIDTLLQLFLVFMLTASFANPSVKLDLPRTNGDSANPKTPIVVSVDASEQLYLNQEPIGLAALSDRLRSLLAQGAADNIALRADRKTSYETVLRTIVEIHRAGAQNIRLAYEEAAGR